MQCGLPSFTMQNFKLRFYRKQTITDNCVFFLKRTAGSTTLYDVICWKLLMDEMDWWRSFHRNKIKETEKQNQFYWINKRWRKKKNLPYFFLFCFLSISLGRLLLCKLIDFLVVVLFLCFLFSVSHLSRWCILFLFLAFFAVSIYNIHVQMMRWQRFLFPIHVCSVLV